MNASASVGKATLAMLVLSEDSNMAKERPASAPEIEGFTDADSATISSLAAFVDVMLHLVLFRSQDGANSKMVSFLIWR